MTKAKIAITEIVADGFDVVSGQPLIAPAGPERPDASQRQRQRGYSHRPMWREWVADITIEFDADMITAESVVNSWIGPAGRLASAAAGRSRKLDRAGLGHVHGRRDRNNERGGSMTVTPSDVERELVRAPCRPSWPAITVF